MNENRCVCCDASIPEGRQICPICEKNGNDRPKRNIDRIREMTVEELAEFLDKITYQCGRPNGCERCPLNVSVDCDKGVIAKWLESEVSKNENC